MAHNNSVVSTEASHHDLWLTAPNDHYCPNAATCRHAVIDISPATLGVDAVDPSELRQKEQPHTNDHYYSERGDFHRFRSGARPTAYDCEYASSSGSGYVSSPDARYSGRDCGVEHSLPLSQQRTFKVKLFAMFYEPYLRFSVAVSTTHPTSFPTIFTQRRKPRPRALSSNFSLTPASVLAKLAYLETFTFSKTGLIAERCEMLTALGNLLNQQHKLLATQHDRLLGMVEKSSDELRLPA